MKKFLETVDPSARLLDNESRSVSSGILCEQGGLYQGYPCSTMPGSAPNASSANGDCGGQNSLSTDREGRCAGGGGGGGKEKNGKRLIKIGKKNKDDPAKVHRIREVADERVRVLCTFGCCGQGRLDVTWLVAKRSVFINRTYYLANAWYSLTLKRCFFSV